MTSAELAAAIYAHHRRAKLRAKRREGRVPTWAELEPAERARRVELAARLAVAYSR